MKQILNKKYIYLYLTLGVLFLVWVLTHPSDPDALSLTVHRVQERTEHTTIHIEYPEFDNASKEFNAHIKKVVDDDVIEFKKAVAETESVRETSAGKGMPIYEYQFTASWSPDSLTPDTVSFVLRTSYYTGGAHGGHDVHTFTYDMKKKREITLQDVFGLVPDYLLKLSQYTSNDLKSQLTQSLQGKPNLDMIQSGTSSVPENFQLFTLGSEGMITFYFPEYTVAPYVAGEQVVHMPISYIISEQSQ